jgi:hypothetical protein
VNDTSKILLTDQDLGLWFSINGTSIKSQPELDLAVISLAGLYGYKKIPMPVLEFAHKVVHRVPADTLEDSVVAALISYCELAIRHLNDLAGELGYKFDFAGEEYDQLMLYKLGDLQN